MTSHYHTNKMNNNKDQFILKVIFASLLLLITGACSREPVSGYPSPPIAGSEVVIEVNQLKPDTPLYFSHKKNGKSIDFFVLLVGEKVRSYFDACVTCYPKKRGYRYDGDTVVCRACNQRFPVSTLEKGMGKCYPINIPGKLEGGIYRIPLAKIEEGVKWF